MPRLPNKNKPKTKKPLVSSITCLTCAETKKPSEFYTSASVFHAGTGRVPYCKVCLKNMSVDGNGNIDIEKFKKVLKEIDKPFLQDVLQSAYNESSKVENGDVIGIYFKNINSLGQYKKLGWEDSKFGYENEDCDNSKYYDSALNDFVITKEMITKWGSNFEVDQYMMLEDLYQNLFNSYDIDNRSQEEYLKTACLYQLRNIEAIRQGDADEAKKWGSLFDSYMASGKLKPNQLSESDKMGGVTNFATFFQYIEKSNDFIPTFPDLILDDIDYSIFMLLNYNRTLMGLPEISLGEVKNFMTYDYQKGQEIIFPQLVINDQDDAEIENGDNDGVI